MNKAIFLLFMSLLINGCTTIGVGTAEITGVSLFHDRRSAESILLDEKIENDAMFSLNFNSTIRENSHVNVTAYNGKVLLTGETTTQDLISHINSTVQALNDVRLVQNQMLIDYPSSFATRTNDSFITASVKSALTSDSRMPGFDTTRIKVVTENGRVFLMGMVYPKEGDIAAEIAQRQDGVREVIKVFEYL
jgi:osmotically-inducible protein OsmY